MLSGGLECFLEGWNAFDRVEIHLYRVQMFSRGLDCFRQSWNTFVQSWNALERGAMLSRGLEYLSTSVGMLFTELECFLEGCNAL
jgi:hypothetical protein